MSFRHLLSNTVFLKSNYSIKIESHHISFNLRSKGPAKLEGSLMAKEIRDTALFHSSIFFLGGAGDKHVKRDCLRFSCQHT